MLTGEENNAWTLEMTSVLWAPSVSGKLSPFKHGATVDVDRSFSDTINNLNLSSFLNIAASYDRFVFSGNIMYANAVDKKKYRDLPALQIPALGVITPPGTNIDGKANSTEFMTTTMGGYRIMDTPAYTLDLLAGTRFWYISNDVTVNAYHPSFGQRHLSYGENFWWIDPLIGARVFVPVTKNVSFKSEVDAGGLGVGSDFTWSMLSSINYKFTPYISATAGYRIFKVHYDHQDHVYNILQSGPVLGLAWHF